MHEGLRFADPLATPEVVDISTKQCSGIVFDFFGTLAGHWDDVSGTVSPNGGFFEPYLQSLQRSNVKVDAEALASALSRRFDGATHRATDLQTWTDWVRLQYVEIFEELGVGDVTAAVDALREVDDRDVHAYPESEAVLRQLRERGFVIAVCSNWGWNLDASLQQTGLHGLVDVAVTSARVGAFKPHRSIYQHTFEALGVRPAEVVFVGDSVSNDVRGALAAGAGRAIHLDRTGSRSSSSSVDQATSLEAVPVMVSNSL